MNTGLYKSIYLKSSMILHPTLAFVSKLHDQNMKLIVKM